MMDDDHDHDDDEDDEDGRMETMMMMEIKIKRSNIFFTNKDNEVLFINQINDSNFYYDLKNLKNVLFLKARVFNVPYKLIIGNDKLNEILDFEFTSKKLVFII